MNQKKIQEMQILEQNLQNLLYQKQAFQIELSETESALKEVKESKDEVFKIVGQLMLKANKEKIIEELTNKEKILSLRMTSIEKQENSIIERLESLKEELTKDKK
jgi:prefoldin beta subunit